MLSFKDCLEIKASVIAMMNSSLISDETKEEVKKTILYKDVNYPVEAWFSESYSSFAFSLLKMNSESMFRVAVELSLNNALICFKLLNIPYIPDNAWCDHCCKTKYKLSVVEWLYNQKYFSKSRHSPCYERALVHFSHSARHHKNEDLLKFLKEKDLYVAE